jgi:hypothetical protein
VKNIKNRQNILNLIKHSIFKYYNFAIGFLVVILNKLLFDYLNLNSSIIKDGRPLEVIQALSPQIFDLFTSNILEHEHNIFLGFGLVLMVCSSIIFLLTIKKKNFDFKFIFLTTVFFLLISLGTSTPFYIFWYRYLPLFKFSRTPARAMFFVFALLPILSIYSFTYIQKLKFIWARYVVTSLVGIFIIVSFLHSNISTTPLPQAEIYRLKEVIELNKDTQASCKILYLPYTQSGNFFGSFYEYSLSTLACTSINGYHPYPSLTLHEIETTKLCSINEFDFTNPDIVNIFKAQRINYAVVFKKYFSPEMQNTFPLECATPQTIEEVYKLESHFIYEDEDFIIIELTKLMK